MSTLAERLLRTIRKKELLRAGDRVAVAVSGGADSVALLCLIAEIRGELGIVPMVAHVNHKLRGSESDEDERFVAELAAKFGLELERVDAAVEGDSGIESSARRLRYEFFRELARSGRASKIATAHTLDDQAETVLLRVFRGTGIRGLAGVHPRIVLRDGTRAVGEVVRPLLGFRREELRDYLRTRRQDWREDSSNLDLKFLRNRVRARLLPLIAEDFGEAAIEHMGELAEIARAEEEFSSQYSASFPSLKMPPNLAEESSIRSAGEKLALDRLELDQLLSLPLALQRRVVRSWIEANAPETGISFRLIEEILELALATPGKVIELPVGNAQPASKQRSVRREQRELVITAGGPAADSEAAEEYECVLTLPGDATVPELRARVEARVVDVESVPENERDRLLDPLSSGNKVTIRNWRAGDRYWPAHTASQKKVKELLGDRHAAGAEKKLWPVAVSESGSLVWMRGFPVPAALRARSGTGILIRVIKGD